MVSVRANPNPYPLRITVLVEHLSLLTFSVALCDKSEPQPSKPNI